jgi:competence protein ComEA
MLPAPTRPLWGWTVPARVLLALLAVAGAAPLVVGSPGGERASAGVPELVVDLNSAPAGVLGALPKLGPALVGRIVVARARAPFRSLDDFDERVRGIGPATIAALRRHVRIGPVGVQEVRPRPSSSPRMAQNAP